MIQQEQKRYEESNKKTVKTKNPVTEEIINKYNILNKQQINEATKKAKDAFVREWRTINIDKRTGFLHDFAAELRKNKEHLAKTATLEMGKE